MKQIYRTTVLILLTAILSFSQTFAQWEQTGPYGGDIRVLAFKENTNTVFARTRERVTSRSFDGGQNWEVLDLSTDYKGFKLTTMGDYLIINSTIDKISRSLDDGTTWEAANSGFDPSGVGFFQKCGSHLFAKVNNGLFVSADSAATWTDALVGQPALDIDCSAATESTIFVGVHDGIHGIFRSSDYGTTWTELTHGLEIPEYPGYYVSVSSIAVRNDTVFAATDYAGVLMSTDNGDTFNPVNNGITDYSIYSNMVFKGEYLYLAMSYYHMLYRFDFTTNTWTLLLDNDINFNELYCNNNILYTATNTGVLSIDDSGSTTTITALNNNLALFNGFSIDRIGSDIFTTSRAGGTYKTYENAETWENLSGNGDLRTYSYSQYVKAEDDALFLTSGDNKGGYYSSDLGNSWTYFSPYPSKDVSGTTKIGDAIFVATRGGGIFRSTDGAQSFESINTGLPTASIQDVHSIGSTLYISIWGEGLYRSTDYGDTWTYNGLQGLVNFKFELISVDGTIFVGVYNSFPGDGIYRTNDDGTSWEKVLEGSNPPYLGVTNLYSVGNRVYAGIYNGDNYILYKSDDLGDTWTSITDILGSAYGFYSSANDSLIFIPTGEGIYVSSNSGDDWIEISGNLPNNARYAKTLLTDNKIYLTTYNRSVWQRNLSDFQIPQISAIVGTEYPCISSEQTYSVTDIPLVDYAWQVPSDWTITSGQGTSSITVTVGSSAGIVLVSPSNSFGSGTSQYITANPEASSPNQPSEITGNVSPNVNTSQEYSVTNVDGVVYTWEVPSDWAITAGQNTNSITVTVGSEAGTISCTPSNDCGIGTLQTLTVDVSIVGINNLSSDLISIYPNPANNIIKIEFQSELKGSITISITDISGKEVYKNEMTTNSHHVNINNFEKGIYFVQLKNAELNAVYKLVVN